MPGASQQRIAVGKAMLAGLCVPAALVLLGAWVDGRLPGPLARKRGEPNPTRLWPVLLGGKVGYIDRTGTLVLPARYDTLCSPDFDALTRASPCPSLDSRVSWAHDFVSGRCLVRQDGQARLIDVRGRRWPFAQSAADIAAFREAAKRRWERESRRVLGGTRPIGRLAWPCLELPPEEFELAPGLRWALRPDRSLAVVDATGRPTHDQEFIHVQPFRGGLARVIVVDKEEAAILARWLAKIGVRKGIGPTYSYKWGYMDRRGRWVWRPTR